MKQWRRRRNSSGLAFLAELPLVLWVFFFVLFFPMINLATMFVRITFLYGACHNACISAARARTFQNSINGDPTAISLAQDGANAVTNSFPGVHTQTINTSIVITNINTQVQTFSNTPLNSPPDVTNYTYQIQVNINGAVDPFFPIPLPISISGLNQPMFLTITDRQYFENPQGLIY